EISTATAEGRAQIATFNREINENTETIRANVSQMEKQKMNIGNYKSALDGLSPGLGSAVEGQIEMVQGLTKGAAAMGAAGLAAGALLAAYIRSTAGARDLARAKDLLSSALDRATSSMGNFIRGAKEGPGILERIAFWAAYAFDSTAALMGALDAAAKENLKWLDLSRTYAEKFGKEDERQAELRRRIRDDESKSIEERIRAASEVDMYMERIGKRTITVIE